MEARAYLKHVRISPRKVKIVCDLIRGKDVGVAAAILMNTPKAACEPMLKLLRSAAANADLLYVDQVFVCPGPVMKRVRPRAQGRAFRILKRTSHITIVLKEKE